MVGTTERGSRRRVAAVGITALVLVGGVAAACSSGQEKYSAVGAAISDDGAANDIATAAAAPEAAGGEVVAAEPASLTAEELDATAAAQDRAIIRTATVAVDVDELEPSVTKAKAATEAAGGIVFAEQTAVSDSATSTLTVKIGPDGFDALLDQLRGLGDLAEQQITTDDVTDQLIDVDARIKAAEQSLQRSYELLDRADTVVDLAVVDAEVTKRQTELERLNAQKASLERQVSLSTIVLTLRSRDEVAPVVAEEQNEPLPGFGDGLSGGVDALVAVLSVGSAVLGALLPFLPFVLVLVGVVLIRRRRPTPTAPAS